MASLFPQFGAVVNPSYAAGRISPIARAIRAACGQVGRVPFDPDACAEYFNIRVRLVAMSDCRVAGRLLNFSSGYEIEICATDSWHRRRFTLSHELAHLCFISVAPVFPDERGVISRVEKVDQRRRANQLNKIASELLMPRAAFTGRARDLPPSFDSLLLLAGVFNVSPAAILRRLSDLSTWSVSQATWKIVTGEDVVLKPVISAYPTHRSSRSRNSKKPSYHALAVRLKEKKG